MFLTIEDTNDEIDDEIEIDIELDTLTFGEVASERHNDMQAVSMEAEDASSTCAVTQFFGDNIDLNIVVIPPSIPWV